MKKSSPAGNFAQIGLARKQACAHEVAVIPKRYPDSILHLFQHNVPMSIVNAGDFKQLNLYATDISKYPQALFTDPKINWHGQQCSRLGLIAAAGLFLPNHDTAIVTALQSDLCQQLYRHPTLKIDCKTQVDTRYGMWYRLLLNALVDFCVDSNIDFLYIPTSKTVLKRMLISVSPDLFTRIYDDPSLWLRCSPRTLYESEYWEIPVSSNLQRFVPLELISAPRRKEIQGVCIFHDIESNIDTSVSTADCDIWLRTMLDIESRMGISLTYSVLGVLLPQLRPLLNKHNVHSLALHSYDHRISSLNQLTQIRNIDHKIRGYRPPQSKITTELTHWNLSYRNFEWLLSSSGSLGTIGPTLDNYIVKIPVHMDDYSLHVGECSIDEWITRFQSLLDSEIPLVTVGLHDCYAGHWLPHYPNLLRTAIAKRTLWNCDDIAGAVYYNEVI